MARDAVTADAYDNALMGMGLTQALAFLRQQPALQAYFIYQRHYGRGGHCRISTLTFSVMSDSTAP